MNILKKANEIINERSEEKARQYGPFIECNRRAAIIASVLSNKEITTEDIYNFQIALKLARESYSHKEDNLMDAAAYIGALNNFHDGVEPGEDLVSTYLGREHPEEDLNFEKELTPNKVSRGKLSARAKIWWGDIGSIKRRELREIYYNKEKPGLSKHQIQSIYDMEQAKKWWKSAIINGEASEIAMKYFPIHYDTLNDVDLVFMYLKEKKK